jgi:hypothetical protein
MATEVKVVAIDQTRLKERVAEILQDGIDRGVFKKEEYLIFLEAKSMLCSNLVRHINLNLLNINLSAGSGIIGAICATEEEILEALKAFCAKTK